MLFNTAGGYTQAAPETILVQQVSLSAAPPPSGGQNSAPFSISNTGTSSYITSLTSSLGD